jgi:hypothetical protein
VASSSIKIPAAAPVEGETTADMAEMTEEEIEQRMQDHIASSFTVQHC